MGDSSGTLGAADIGLGTDAAKRQGIYPGSPLVVVKPRCPSQTERLQRVESKDTGVKLWPVYIKFHRCSFVKEKITFGFSMANGLLSRKK